MNAIQFIQQHGVEKAREVVDLAPHGATHLSNDTRHYVNADFNPLPIRIKEQLPKLIVIEDLKRLVESVGRINFIGGISEAKTWVEKTKFGLERGHYPSYSTSGIEEKIKRNEQAIADYESIYSEQVK